MAHQLIGGRLVRTEAIDIVEKTPTGASLTLQSGAQIHVQDDADTIAKMLGCQAFPPEKEPNNGPAASTNHMGAFTAASLPPSAGGEYPGQEPIMPNMNQPLVGAQEPEQPAVDPKEEQAAKKKR